MYKIPGHEKITALSFTRYQAAKKNDAEIKELIDNSTYDWKQKIEMTAKKDRFNLIKQGLDSNNPVTQLQSAKMISFAQEDKIIKLIEYGFTNHNVKVRRACVEKIAYIEDMDKRFEMVELCINKKIARDIILIDLNGYLKNHSKWTELKTKTLKSINEDFNAGKELTPETARLIRKAPKNKQVELIKIGLMSSNIKVQESCANQIIMLRPINDNQKEELIKIAINSNSARVRKICSFKIEGAPTKIKIELIKYCLSNKHVRELITPEVIKSLSDIELTKFLSIIEDGLENGSIGVKKIYTLMIYAFSEDKRKELFKQAKEMFGNDLIKAPLYKNKSISNDKFSRQDFEKTGSKTTLLGGKLKNKLIIRELSPEAFISWQKLYENHELWKNGSFEYVPIEPIQSFRLNKDKKVDVFSGTLDLSLDAWKGMSGNFLEELENDKNKILKILEQNNVRHGHTHDNNFCLRFFRKENGDVDFSKKPHIYLIDFDQAISP